MNSIVSEGDVVVINHPNGVRNQSIIRRAKEEGAKIVISHTEGRPNTREQSEWLADKKGESHAVLCWNRHQVSTESKYHQNSVLVGNPRFDVYTQGFRHLIRSRGELLEWENIPDEGETVLFLSSFPQAKFKGNLSWYKQDYKDLKVPLGEPDKIVDREYYHRQYMASQAINASAKGYNVIVKPHPMEDKTWWDWVGQTNGFHVLHGGFSHDWINAADKIVSWWSCTTIMESWKMGKSVFSMGEPDEDSGLASEVSKIADNFGS